MLVLELKAPFAACRPMMAGWYRPTSVLLTPTAAYGLLLNVACVESRLTEEEKNHSGRVPSSLIRDDLPQIKLAIGIPEVAATPQVQTIFQQLHNYPVGKDAGVPADWTKGSKNNISPVKREFLSDVHAMICLDENEELENRVCRGLNGEFNSSRYGLPFIGDNTCLIDRLQILNPTRVLRCKWCLRIEDHNESHQLSTTTRLTTWIDRADMTKSQSALFAPCEEATSTIPEEAWIWIPPKDAQMLS